MDDTILRVAATLWGEAGICGLAGMYAAAYVMNCRMQGVGRGTWEQMLSGTGPFARLGGWSWYTKVESEGAVGESLRGLQWDAYHLAVLLVVMEPTRAQWRALARYHTGLELPPEPMLYCMSEQDVAANGWRDGDVVVEGPKGYALHLYASWPEKRQP